MNSPNKKTPEIGGNLPEGIDQQHRESELVEHQSNDGHFTHYEKTEVFGWCPIPLDRRPRTTAT